MATSSKNIFDAALTLDESERAELAGLLIESLDAKTEEGVEAAWLIEVEKRMEELSSGAVKTMPWDEVRARLHQPFDG